jgi:hypothetical protein
VVFDSLPQWDREKIESSDSWVKLQRRLGNAPVSLIEDKRPTSEIMATTSRFRRGALGVSRLKTVTRRSNG